MILLDLCSSTLGWAMDSNFPIVYVDNISGPMMARDVDVVRRSAFYISSMEDGWENVLKVHPKLSHEQRESEWMAMLEARREFDLNFVNVGGQTIHDRLAESLHEVSQASK